MKALMGVAPIAWSNDDLPELGGETSLETCLAEAREAGFEGVETGGKFPKHASELRPVLEEFSLQLCGGWYSGTMLGNEFEAEKDRVYEQLELFRDLDAPCLVYGETAGTIQNRRHVPLNRRPVLDEEQFRSYGRKLTKFCEWCADAGMRIAFHHHMGTAVETERDIDLLVNFTGEAVGLLYDAGHLAFAGGDVLGVTQRHARRILHVHTKDVRGDVLASIDRTTESFLDSVLKGVFTVPGDGSLDYSRIIGLLGQLGYEGWFVVEAEQDPAKAPPLEYARIGYRAVEAALVQADYQIERKSDAQA